MKTTDNDEFVLGYENAIVQRNRPSAPILICDRQHVDASPIFGSTRKFHSLLKIEILDRYRSPFRVRQCNCKCHAADADAFAAVVSRLRLFR